MLTLQSVRQVHVLMESALLCSLEWLAHLVDLLLVTPVSVVKEELANQYLDPRAPVDPVALETAE